MFYWHRGVGRGEAYFAATLHLSVLAISVRYLAERISAKLNTMDIATSEGTTLSSIEKKANSNGA